MRNQIMLLGLSTVNVYKSGVVCDQNKDKFDVYQCYLLSVISFACCAVTWLLTQAKDKIEIPILVEYK